MDEKKGPSDNIFEEMILAGVIIILIIGVFGVYFGRVFDWYGVIVGHVYGVWNAIHRTVEIILITLSIGVAGLIYWIIGRWQSLRERIRAGMIVSQKEADIQAASLEAEAARGWDEIRALAESGNPSDWNMAVLRADALLDEVLAEQGYEGPTFADRMKIVDPTRLPSMDRVWSAHRLRNMIAHDPLQQHTREMVIHALRSYEAALKELGVIREEKIQ